MCTATSAGGTSAWGYTIRLDTTSPMANAPTMSGSSTVPILGTVVTTNTTTIDASVSDNLSGLAYAEYFFDNDPGLGNGIPMDLSNINNANASANLTTLSTGQKHTLYVRCHDVAGNWSTNASLQFTKL